MNSNYRITASFAQRYLFLILTLTWLKLDHVEYDLNVIKTDRIQSNHIEQ